MDELHAAIEADKAANTDCQYSTSSSKSCRTMNGKTECETVNRVLRYCPGDRQPCEIFTKTLPPTAQLAARRSQVVPAATLFQSSTRSLRTFRKSWIACLAGSSLGAAAVSLHTLCLALLGSTMAATSKRRHPLPPRHIASLGADTLFPADLHLSRAMLTSMKCNGIRQEVTHAPAIVQPKVPSSSKVAQSRLRLINEPLLPSKTLIRRRPSTPCYYCSRPK